MQINDVARVTGLTPKAIRYYEAQSLVIPHQRASNGYRIYSRENLDHLCFLQHARAVGFSVKESGHLLALYADQANHSASVKALVAEKLSQLQQKRKEIERLEATLTDLWACCDGQENSRCAILDRLATAGFDTNFPRDSKEADNV
ncbi:MerR family transcriptional regulator [Simiduia aestuariiviva]|uniref:Cu(I)-responsive transcriptional regulator n=1 Tax=Simiduia aestuariiviva TaxID=1510459 RepID=A0A839UND1_9GAMM|nr:MerR family transcriptional regulator [Simiduia aestuariiviva]MBB3168251.1 Cu(I)-responsive transcriptional regulator [Simiduia aestuariiviva]